MNKVIFSLLFASITVFTSHDYVGSTTASVTLAGGIIKAKQVDPSNKKYKRKDCPVCKGKGWYISGDKITKVECGYCEPETKDSLVEHPPVRINGPRTIIHKR